MKFFVNFLSAFRIAAAFAIIPTIMFGMYKTTFVLYVLGAISDWFDGFLARKFDVCSKLGGVMDHIGDKLLVCNTLIMLAVMMPVWFVVVPIILMIARELYISGLREFLGTQKIEMPVPKYRFSMGKIKTTFQMITIAAFLGVFAIGSIITANTTSRAIVYMLYILPQVGLYGLWVSLAASLISAAQYTRTFAQKLKQVK
ncbi:MAG TPA: hypothetical protein DEA31_01095 [Alphaproteobacteria bacterium]|nr:hypothetical protein [Alphaproteobacteria bacterium]